MEGRPLSETGQDGEGAAEIGQAAFAGHERRPANMDDGRRFGGGRALKQRGRSSDLVGRAEDGDLKHGRRGRGAGVPRRSVRGAMPATPIATPIGTQSPGA